MSEIGAAFGRYPQFDRLPPERQREIAEEVRAPWAAGGPDMAKRTDLEIDTPAGRVRLRIHDPSTHAPKPALIYLHGGGWTMFSIDTHDRLMREYASRADMIVIGVDYALSPEAKFPTALDQVIETVRWARANARQLNLNAEHIALGGDSAGGNLALAACLALRDAGEGDAVRALVLNYAALTSECSPHSQRRYGGPGYMLGSEEMARFWRNYMRNERDARNPLVCPLEASLQALPPTFMVIAQCDLLAEQNLALAERLREAGVPVRAIVYEGASHSFLEAVAISQLSQRALQDTAQWLRAQLA